MTNEASWLRSLSGEIRNMIFQEVFRHDHTEIVFNRNAEGWFVGPTQLRDPRQTPALIKALRPDPKLYAEVLRSFDESKRTYTLCEDNRWGFNNINIQALKAINVKREDWLRYKTPEPWRQLFAAIASNPQYLACEPKVLMLDIKEAMTSYEAWFSGYSLRRDHPDYPEDADGRISVDDETYGDALIDISEPFDERPNDFKCEKLERIVIETKERLRPVDIYMNKNRFVLSEDGLFFYYDIREIIEIADRALGHRGVVQSKYDMSFAAPGEEVRRWGIRTVVWDMTED